MKKKLFKIIVCITALILTAFTVGCADKQKTPSEVPKGGEILLNGFERWNPDFQVCRISVDFGKISINRDARYVKTGQVSARIDPLGSGWMYIPTYSETFDYDYTDFSFTKNVKTTIYNPGLGNATMRMGLVTAVSSVDKIDRVGEEEYTLAPGWNTVEFIVDPAIVNLMGDIEDVQGVYYKFESSGETAVGENTPCYYLDSVILVNDSTPHAAGAESAFTFGENEIIDFEHFYDKYFFLNDFDATLEIVSAADFGISATSGFKVLHLVIPGTNTGSWTYYLKFAAPLLNLSALGRLSQSDFDRAYISWDVYNAYISSYNIVSIFEKGSGASDHRIGREPKPGQWTSVSVKLSEIEENNPGWKENKGQLAFSILDNSKDSRELFFDNFRLEIK